MQQLSALKEDMEFNKGLGDIIEVLKTSAIIQFRSFQLKENLNEAYAAALESCFRMLVKKKLDHPYLVERPDKPSVILVVTSDEGFLGELNTLLINATLEQHKSKDDEIIVLGERGAKYLEDVNESFVWLPALPDDIEYAHIENIRDYLLKSYESRFGRVLIVFPEFVSLTLQRVEVLQFLPFQMISEGKDDKIGIWEENALVEPGEAGALAVIIELWTAFKVLEIAISSKKAEYAARIMHLEGSTQELAHINRMISLSYFRQVHNLRDKVIREITASKLLFRKKY